MSMRRLPVLGCALCTVMAAASAVLLSLGPERPLDNDLFGGVGGASFVLLSLTFAGVGAVVATRARDNSIGWMFCITGLITGVGMLAYVYASYGLYARAEPLAGSTAAAWLFNAVSSLVAGMLALSLLLFPDGRLPSRRWMPAMVVTLAGMALIVLGGALRPGPFDDPFAVTSNPVGVPGTRNLMDALVGLAWPLMVAGMVAATVSASLRLRRSRGIQRQQLKWVLAVGAMVAAATVIVMTSWFVWLHSHTQVRIALIGVAFAAFPIAAGIAILRYRLYDIDVVINRALVYGTLTATLAAVYLACVLVLQFVLNGLTGDSGLAVAASTLAVAALFRPARARIQDGVDRRFYRRRYDAQRTLDAFATRLRDEVELHTLESELRALVTETVQPAHVSLWLRDAEGAR